MSRAVAGLLAVLALTGCIPMQVFEGHEDGRRLAVAGHSIPYSAGVDLAAELRPDYRFALDARPGLALGESGDLIDWLAAADVDVAVVDLAANDLIRDVPNGDIETMIENVLDRLAGIRCLLWVDVPLDSFPGEIPDWTARAESLNDWLRAEAQARDHLRIIDWSGLSSGRPDWFGEDRLHLSFSGRAAYAAFLRTEIDAHCGGPAAGVPAAPPPPTPREPPTPPPTTTSTTTTGPG